MSTRDTTFSGASRGRTADAGAHTRLASPAIAALTLWRRVGVVGVAAIAAFFNLWQLGQEGYANTYYAATIKSMVTSWHTFFFASFDSAGFVAVDKPPLGFWVQAISAKIFGFSGVSILAPEAVAGVLSVVLMYYLVSRAWGAAAGLIAALALAVTPITVVISRNNTIDSLLILTLILGGWAALRAGTTGKLRWLLLCAAIVGLGFNIKMLQAYLVVPAYGLLYLLSAPVGWWTRIRRLGLFAVVLVVVSLAWSLAVDLTPAMSRPYVSDSGTNSELSLAIGYNGIGRVSTTLLGGLQAIHVFGITIDLNVAPAFAPEIGNPSLGRLFSATLGGQASWLLILAIVGLVASLLQTKPRLPLDARGQALVLWGGWLAAAFAFFSASRFFHLYYLCMLAPPVAALSGIGAAALWTSYRTRRWQGWLLPLTLLGAAALQVNLLSANSDWSGWLAPIVLAMTVVAALVLAVGRLNLAIEIAPGAIVRAGPRAALAATTLGLAGLMVAPTAWAAASVADNAGAAALPQAGPASSGGGGFGSGRGFGGAGQRAFNGLGSGTGATQNGAPGAPGTNGQQNGASSPPHGNVGGTQNGAGTAGGAQSSTGAGTPGQQTNVGGTSPRTFGGRGRNFGGFGRSGTLDPKLVRYLLEHQGKTTFLVATTTSSLSSLFILATNRPAMSLGGYQGWDKIVTPTRLAALVKNETVRYFYIAANGGGNGFGSFGDFGGSRGLAGGTLNTQSASTDQTGNLTTWVAAHCSVVPTSKYATTVKTATTGKIATTTGAGGFSRGGGTQLYDCAAT